MYILQCIYYCNIKRYSTLYAPWECLNQNLNDWAPLLLLPGSLCFCIRPLTVEIQRLLSLTSKQWWMTTESDWTVLITWHLAARIVAKSFMDFLRSVVHSFNPSSTSIILKVTLQNLNRTLRTRVIQLIHLKTNYNKNGCIVTF